MKKYILLFCFFLISLTALSQVQTMYWIGGAGNWNDLSHWSFQSGSQGATQPSSIPTSDTHVIFDANSGLNGTGTTPVQLNARSVTLNAEVVIKSLTFDSSLAAHSPRIINNFHIRVTEDVTWQKDVTLTISTSAISMEPLVGKTQKLTLNGGNILFLSKSGAGNLDIEGTITSGRYYFTSGINNYTASTARFAGNNSYSFQVSNSAVLNMPNLTLLETNLRVSLNTTTQFYAPLLATWTGIGTAFSLVDVGGTVNLNLPSLQIWNLDTMNTGTTTSSITIPNGTIVTTASSWVYTGNLNAGTSELHIKGTSLTTKNGTLVNKVYMENQTNSIVSGNSTIKELNFVYSNGGLTTNMSIGKLYLAPSRVYSITGTSLITITDNIIDSTPDCTPFYILQSNATGSVARINNTSGQPINLKNAIIARINVIGGVMNVVGVDFENNSTVGTTLNFVEPVAKTIYWVGAAGDDEWNNQANWSATSGGSGGYCLPTLYDDIIFDNNSVVTAGSIKVTNNSASFHDITVQNNAPIFNFIRGGSIATAMNCFGSWYMRSNIIVATDNTQFRSKDLGETITSNGSHFRITYFHGTGGWTFQDSFQTQNNPSYHVFFRGGTLNTNTQNFYIGGNFVGNEPQNPKISRNLILKSSEISVNSNWMYDYAESTLNASNSTITLRNGANFRALAGHNYYDVNSLTQTPAVASRIDIYGADITFHNFHIFSQIADFKNTGIVANEIRLMPVQLRANLIFRGNVTANIIEVQSNGILQANNASTVTVNQNFITHTADCQGLMQMNVIDQTAGNKFNFKVLNSVHVPNVWMIGVNAVPTTGVNYSATGLEGANVTNWTFTTPPAKELYWIGVADNNWNNGLNWTSNSDGTPSAGGCVPTKYDNVHFNSFSTGNLPIHILDQPAYFNNLIAHTDAPVGITITYPSGLSMEAYSYGNLIQMGENMIIARLHLLGNDANGQLINKGTSGFQNLTVNNATSNWIFTNNIKVLGTYTQTGATVTVNANTWTGGDLSINGTAFTLNVQNVSGGTLSLTKGNLKASGLTMNLAGNFASSGNSNILHARSVDIRNSIITVKETWAYNNLSTAILQAEGSTIIFDNNFLGTSGHVYGTIETDAAEVSGSGSYLRGNITADNFVINENKRIVDNNTFKTLFLKPRGLTLWIDANSIQTVTDHLYISGTPCLTNVVRAGTETGSSQASATATINYTNATPTVANVDNTFDYVRIGGINASNSKLFLQVNATQIGLNTNVESIVGTPGLIGLGADISCKQISSTDPTTYTITAEKFYAGPEATFVWYKKNAGVFVNLGVPNNTREIDVRNYGYDGEYKVEILYDPLHPTVALRCPQVDVIIVSYNPLDVVIDPGKEHYQFCDNSNGMKVSDFEVSIATQNEMTSRGAEIKWYPTASGGTAFNPNDVVVQGNYYSELVVTNTGCISPVRTLVTVGIDAVVVSNAGPDQSKNMNYPILFTMSANNATVGTGQWVVVSGDVTIMNPSLYNSIVTLNSGKSAELKWIVTNGACVASSNAILSKLNTPPLVNPSLRMRVSQ